MSGGVSGRLSNAQIVARRHATPTLPEGWGAPLWPDGSGALPRHPPGVPSVRPPSAWRPWGGAPTRSEELLRYLRWLAREERRLPLWARVAADLEWEPRVVHAALQRLRVLGEVAMVSSHVPGYARNAVVLVLRATGDVLRCPAS